MDDARLSAGQASTAKQCTIMRLESSYIQLTGCCAQELELRRKKPADNVRPALKRHSLGERAAGLPHSVASALGKSRQSLQGPIAWLGMCAQGEGEGETVRAEVAANADTFTAKAQFETSKLYTRMSKSCNSSSRRGAHAERTKVRAGADANFVWDPAGALCRSRSPTNDVHNFMKQFSEMRRDSLYPRAIVGQRVGFHRYGLC